MADVKPLYINSSGVFQAVGGTDTAVFPNLKLTQLTTANGVLSTDGSGNVNSGKLVNANVDASAAIAYSKLNLSGSIVNADVGSGAAIAYSKLNLSGSIVNADIGTGAAIAYSKLNLSGSITGSDIASGSTIAKYDAASPTFTNAVGVGTPTTGGHATTKTYVDTAIDTAIAGLDYKQQCEVYAYIPTSSGITTIAGVETVLNTAGAGVFSAGMRFLVDFQTADVESGIYTASGSTGAWTLTRASDMAASSDASGAYIFCTGEFDGSAIVSYNKALVCQQKKGDAVVGTNTLTFALYGAGTTYTFSNPLSESSGTVSLNYDTDTLQIASNKLDVKGLNSQFYINGSQVSTNVTASNLNTATAGATSDASSLHAHQRLVREYVNGGTALTAGKAVSASGGNAVAASKTDGKVWGIVVSDPGSGTAYIATSGTAVITTPTGSPSAMDNLYVDTSGDLCTYASLSAGDYATKVGKYLGTVGPSSAPMIAIAIQEFGIKAS